MKTRSLGKVWRGALGLADTSHCMARRLIAKRCIAKTAWMAVFSLLCSPLLFAQQTDAGRNRALQGRVDRLEQEVAELKALVKQMQAAQSASSVNDTHDGVANGTAEPNAPALRNAAF